MHNAGDQNLIHTLLAVIRMKEFGSTSIVAYPEKNAQFYY